ncbi:MAG: putative nitrogen fixation protein NifT [Colwellia sp.]
MANVMLRQEDGYISFYIPKKDVEEKIISLEFDSPDRWGGRVSLANGSAYYIEPLSAPPKLPLTMRARRA